MHFVQGIAQGQYVLKIIQPYEPVLDVTPFLPADRKMAMDSSTHMLFLQELVDTLRKEAYLVASLDTVSLLGDTLFATIYTGPKIYWGTLDVSAIDPLFLRGLQSDLGRMQKEPVRYDLLANVLTMVLTNAENSGYPFAKVWLGHVTTHNDTLHAELVMEKGLAVVMDTLVVTGGADINALMLAEYLDIEPGSVFSRKKLLDIPRKLRELPYLGMQGNPEVRFSRGRARVVVGLENRNASKFDFLLGVLPQGGSGKTVITGSFLADLRNQFALGEQMFVHFERLRPRTQSLELRADFPYLPLLPFGVNGAFDLFKEDTLYTRLHWNAGLLYALSRKTSIRAFLDWQSTSLISIRKSQILQTRKLPDILDLRVRGVGMGIRFSNLDYAFNPRSGPDIAFSGAASLRRIIRNNEILELGEADPEFSPDSLYNALDLRSGQFSLVFDGSYFIRTGLRTTIRVRCQAAVIFTDADLYTNELFRIGGIHVLRGFDEESIFADRYAVFTGEFRLLLSQNSYMSVFSDYGFIGNSVVTPTLDDRAFGVGAGINFETKAGIFGLSLAFGQRKGIPINLRAAKVHFGYVNLF